MTDVEREAKQRLISKMASPGLREWAIFLAVWIVALLFFAFRAFLDGQSQYTVDNMRASGTSHLHWSIISKIPGSNHGNNRLGPGERFIGINENKSLLDLLNLPKGVERPGSMLVIDSEISVKTSKVNNRPVEVYLSRTVVKKRSAWKQAPDKEAFRLWLQGIKT